MCVIEILKNGAEAPAPTALDKFAYKQTDLQVHLFPLLR
jgi:hypothetical protein